MFTRGTFIPESRPSESRVRAFTYLLSLIAGSTDQLDGLAKNAYERRIQRLEDEKKELVRKLENSNRALQKFAHGPIVDNDVAAANESNANEIKRLQDELNTLTKRNQGKSHLQVILKLCASDYKSIGITIRALVCVIVIQRELFSTGVSL